MPSLLRRHDEYGHAHFLTISCYRRPRLLDHDVTERVMVGGMQRTRETLRIVRPPRLPRKNGAPVRTLNRAQSTRLVEMM